MRVSGTLPPEYGDSLSAAEDFKITGCRRDQRATCRSLLSGTLPASYGNLISAVIIDLSGNRGISGTIPSTWGRKLTQATTLNLENNALRGGLPATWRNDEEGYPWKSTLTIAATDFGNQPGCWPECWRTSALQNGATVTQAVTGATGILATAITGPTTSIVVSVTSVKTFDTSNAVTVGGHASTPVPTAVTVGMYIWTTRGFQVLASGERKMYVTGTRRSCGMPCAKRPAGDPCLCREDQNPWFPKLRVRGLSLNGDICRRRERERERERGNMTDSI